MDHQTLVNEDIEAGRKLVKALDDGKVPFNAALWMNYPEQKEWKLVIAMDQAAKDLNAAYMTIARVLNKNESVESRISLSNIKLVKPDDLLVKTMRSLVNVQGLSTVRWSQNVVNGILIEDAIIYLNRTAA